MMKNFITILLALFMSSCLYGQELSADDRIDITRVDNPYIGVFAFGYQGLPGASGYPQFQLNNYGGVPGAVLASADNSTLGAFTFSGHNGTAKKPVGILRVRAMDNFATALTARMDFLIGPNRQQRMTILGENGHVGIGTTTPEARLHVTGTGTVLKLETTNGQAYIDFTDYTGVKSSIEMQDDDLVIGTTANTEPGDVFFQTNGQRRLTVDVGGNVGIGTINPGVKLDVVSSEPNGSVAAFSTTGSSDSYVAFNNNLGYVGYLGSYLSNDFMDLGTDASNTTGGVNLVSNGSARLTVVADGNVGIGTENPGSNRLAVDAGGSTRALSLTGSNTFGTYSTLENTSPDGNAWNMISTGELNSEGSGKLLFHTEDGTGANVKMTIAPDGHVGIGTHSPAALLTVADTLNSDTTSLNVLNNNSSSTTKIIRAEYTGTGYYDGTALYAKFAPRNHYGYGAKLIGNWRGLDVEGQVVGAQIRNTNTVSSGNTAYGISVITADSSSRSSSYGTFSRMDKNGNGNAYGGYFQSEVLGSGNTSYGIVGYGNNELNEVSYGVFADHDASDTGYSLYVNGQAFATSGGVLSSDKRFKEDINPMENALDIINALQPKTYNFKQDGEFAKLNFDKKLQYGFIAQDLEKVLPNVVHDVDVVFMDHENKKGARERDEEVEDETYSKAYKGVNYTAIIPVLTQGIKELSATVEEKDEKIEAMEKEISAMTKDMNDMKAMVNAMNDKFNQMEEDMSACCTSSTDDRTGATNTNVELNGSDIATLEQNSPNPFYEQTIIKYYIPSFAQKAVMTITDMKGSALKSINLEETGLGTITINANELPVGTYVYTLYVDGRQVESKQMILVK